MKRKLSIIGLSAVLCGVITANAFLWNKTSKSLAVAKNDLNYLSITFGVDDIISEEEYVTKEATVQTDQNHNDVTFQLENCKRSLYNNKSYLGFQSVPDGAGSFWNKSEIRSIRSITFYYSGHFLLEWGWEVDEHSNPIYEKEKIFETLSGPSLSSQLYFDFDNRKPNYFRFTSTANSSTESTFERFNIKFDKACEHSSSPYAIKDGISFAKENDHFVVLGFSETPFANVVLPEFIDGIPVTEIYKEAFKGNKVIQSINLDHITTVQDYAFYECTNLSDIGDISNVTLFKYYCFERCIGLSFDLSFSAESIVFGVGSFDYCSNLTSLSFEDGCNASFDINGSFYKCGFKSLYIGSSMTSIPHISELSYLETITVSPSNPYFSASENVLIYTYDTSYLCGIAARRAQTTFVMPEGMLIYSRNNNSIDSCYTLQEFTFNDDVIYMDSCTLHNCENLSKVTLGSSIKYISYGAFSHSGLPEITIPSTMRSIREKSFNYCNNLTKVIIEEGCTSIGKDAFSYCDNLQTIVLPSTLETVERYVFDRCPNLTKLFTMLPSGDYPNENATWFNGKTKIYYSETAITDGSHWHYVDGEPTIWE